MSILAIDFGGTRTRAAWFDDDMTFIKRAETPTLAHESESAVIERIITTAKSVVPANTPIKAIGVAAPGPLNAKTGVIHHSETLPGWHEVSLAEHISTAFENTPVFIENDANLAALAEAAQGLDPVIYLTISTGIGGGAVMNGRLFTGANGLAIEPGHQLIPLPDGSMKKLEELASGTAIGMIAAERLKKDNTIQSTLRKCKTIDGAAVGAAAQAGDPFALQIVTEAGTWLGVGLVNLLHLFNPACIVLGGSVTKLGDLLLNPVWVVIDTHVMSHRFVPENIIRLAALGDDVCLYGAADYALNKITS